MSTAGMTGIAVMTVMVTNTVEKSLGLILHYKHTIGFNLELAP